MADSHSKQRYSISCSNESKEGVEKNSPSVISRPSQNFLIVTIEISLRFLSIILYAVEGVTPERVASSFVLIPLSLHNSLRQYRKKMFRKLAVYTVDKACCECELTGYTFYSPQ